METVKILFCGDFVADNPKNIKFSKDLCHLIKSSDINCVNFEAPIQCDANPMSKSGPTICQSPTSPAFLEENGFNVFTLANNHIFDYGEQGFQQTLQQIKAAYVLGAGDWKDAYAVKIIDIKGLKIGLLSCTHNEFGTLSDCNFGERKLGVAWVNHYSIDAIIQEAKQNVDYLFVLPHAGVENIEIPLPEWRERYKCLIDCGADAVIASHPHIVQGYEIYKGNYIFYSLGNFFFDRNVSRDHWSKGLIVQFILNEGGLHIATYNISKTGQSLAIISDNETLEHNKYLCNILRDNATYRATLDNIMDALYQEYWHYLEYGFNGITWKLSLGNIRQRILRAFTGKRDRNLIINMMRCESHRWLFLRALERYTIINNHRDAKN